MGWKDKIFNAPHCVLFNILLGCSPRNTVAYLGLAEVLILDGEQVNQLCVQVYSGLQKYGFNLNSFHQ